jgi:hypothetical protein
MKTKLPALMCAAILVFCAYAIYQSEREAAEQAKFHVEVVCRRGCTIVSRRTHE